MNYLTKENINIINEWYNSCNLLFIKGNKGIGKTYLAKLIFENYNINYETIDTNNLKDKNISEKINRTIFTKNIFIMINKQTKKGLCIDDLHIFKSNDKKNYNFIINILKSRDNFDCKIIICVDNDLDISKFINNNIILLDHKINICYNIIIDNIPFNICKKNIYKLIQNNHKNLTKIISEILFNKEYISKNKDVELGENIIEFDDLYIKYINHYNTTYLNIVDNIHKIIDEKWADYSQIVLNIYENIYLCDHFEIICIKERVLLNYILYLGIYIPQYYLNIYKNNNKIEYNKYLCFSIHYIHHKNKYDKFYIFNKDSNNEIFFIDKLVNFYKKENMNKIIHNYNYNQLVELINIHLNTYNYFYNKKIRKKTLINLIQKIL